MPFVQHLLAPKLVLAGCVARELDQSAYAIVAHSRAPPAGRAEAYTRADSTPVDLCRSSPY
jgi:hypothetical protein